MAENPALLATDAHDQADGEIAPYQCVQPDEEVTGMKPVASHGVIGNG
jgi:hypothetical protein